MGTCYNLCNFIKKKTALNPSNINNNHNTSIDFEEDSNTYKLNHKKSTSLDSKTIKSPNDTKRTDNIGIDKTLFVTKEKGSPATNYIIKKVLGEGAYGKVVKAVHKLTGATRAIKIIKKNPLQDKADDEIMNEIEMLKNLDHPHIVKIFEFYITDLEYYLVTEFCQGGELFEKIIQNAPFEENFSAALMYQILSAVSYCHSLDIIHRDLKPENILFEEEGNNRNNLSIKIIDFGTAKIFDRTKAEKNIIGSSYYIAPEVIAKNYNEKCDMWSCGVILHILLSGRPPFGGDTDEEILKNIKFGNFSMNHPGWKKVSQEAKDLITRLLTKIPAQRISADEALKHPWFEKFNTKVAFNKLEPEKIKKFINNIMTYNPKKILLRAALGFLVHNSPQNPEVIDSVKLFNLIDSNSDGKIFKEELFKGLKEHLNVKENGLNELKESVEKIFSILDADGNGYIECEEFVRGAVGREQFLQEKMLKYAFSFFDKDDSGEIDVSEIKEIFGKMKGIDSNILKLIIEEVDLNGDEKISFEEFVAMMKSILS